VVLICDMIKNPTTGEVRFMTLQGSMPALEAHVMLNAAERAYSPWQNTRFEGGKFTSATFWSCDVTKLSRFKNEESYGGGGVQTVPPTVAPPTAVPTPPMPSFEIPTITATVPSLMPESSVPAVTTELIPIVSDPLMPLN